MWVRSGSHMKGLGATSFDKTGKATVGRQGLASSDTVSLGETRVVVVNFY